MTTLAILIFLPVMLLVLVRVGVFNPSYAAVAAKWAKPPSRFIEVDGASVHVRDEGTGPVLVMLHGSYTSLHLWTPWVEQLKDEFRIVRMDWAPWALSLDPSGEYTPDRAEQLMGGVLDALGIDKFIGVATSNGANIMTAYAVHHPHRVQALALSTVPVFLPPANQYRNPRVTTMQWIRKHLTPDYFPKFYYPWFLDDIVHQKHRITPELVDLFYEMNNIPGKAAKEVVLVKSNFETVATGLTVANASAVTVPVLIQWGDANTVLLPHQGDAVAKAYASAPVTMIHYSDVAHYPMWEIAERSVADFRQFLAQHDLPISAGKTVSPAV